MDLCVQQRVHDAVASRFTHMPRHQTPRLVLRRLERDPARAEAPSRLHDEQIAERELALAPRLAALLSQQPGAPAEPTDPAGSYRDILARVLTGVLGHHPQRAGA